MSMTMKEYEKWRESEAYAVPMTPDGVKWSQERWRGFSTGYKQAMKDVINLLMTQHEAAKGTHNYWHVAANLVKAEFLAEDEQVSYTGNGTAGRENMTAPTGFLFQTPKREWVGLTDDDYEELLKTRDWGVYLIESAEAKLKEKNT